MLEVGEVGDSLEGRMHGEVSGGEAEGGVGVDGGMVGAERKEVPGRWEVFEAVMEGRSEKNGRLEMFWEPLKSLQTGQTNLNGVNVALEFRCLYS